MDDHALARQIRRYAADRSQWPRHMANAAPSTDYRAGWDLALRTVADLIDDGQFAKGSS